MFKILAISNCLKHTNIDIMLLFCEVLLKNALVVKILIGFKRGHMHIFYFQFSNYRLKV